MRAAKLPRDLTICTLFGEVVKMCECNTCDKEKPAHEYYTDSKYKMYPREQCKDCWKRFKGNSVWGREVLAREKNSQLKENWSYYA